MWANDGTTANTKLVAAVGGPFGSSPSDLVSCNGYLLFIAKGKDVDEELYRSDGTATGTVLVKDIKTVVTGFGSGGLQTQLNTFEPRLVKIGNAVYFSADDGVNGVELWRSDGTATGTSMIKNAGSATATVAPQNFAAIGNILYYKFDDGANGIELWRSDGTATGTYMVKDVYPGSFGAFSLPTFIYAHKGHLYFGAKGQSGGTELWRSDGTETGTVMAADLAPGFGSSSPGPFFSLGDLLLFSAITNLGIELWKYDPLAVPVFEASVASSKISIQPNPSYTGQCTLSNLPTQVGAVHLVNADGAVLRTLDKTAGTTVLSLDGLGLPSGIYYLFCQTGTQRVAVGKWVLMP